MAKIKNLEGCRPRIANNYAEGHPDVNDAHPNPARRSAHFLKAAGYTVKTATVAVKANEARVLIQNPDGTLGWLVVPFGVNDGRQNPKED